MSWPRRHELMDVDLDAYADEDDAPVERQSQRVVEQQRVSVLEAAELARVPVEELLPKLIP